MSGRAAILSKTAFTLGRSCPTKLYYYLNQYPSLEDDDPYLELLADGGFIVGKMAQLLYPEGVLVDTSQGLEAAFRQTRELLERERVTIFEATIISGQKAASIDILVKDGASYELIEVKSKSFDGAEDQEKRGKNGKGIFWTANGKGLIAEWQPLVDDVAFQSLVLSEFLPGAKFSSYLLMPDVAKSTSIDQLAQQFSLIRAPIGARGSPQVKFSGDPAEIRASSFLTKVPVSQAVDLILPEVAESARLLCESIADGVQKIAPVLTRNCSKCEYWVDETEPQNGFRECWGERGDAKPHLFDLSYGTSIKREGKFLFDELIEQGAASLYDVPLEALSGKRGERQRIQIEFSRSGREWVAPELRDFLQGLQYPLHFIDFETSRMAVPYHAGMRPFEQVAFQWSCHSIAAPGDTPRHSDWINLVAEFPNFEFASALMRQIGSEGTVLVWAQHEATTLKDIASQMRRFGKVDAKLTDWIDLLIGEKGAQGRLVDMNRLTSEYYFHPLMGGKTSLKAVLPAIWGTNPRLRELVWLKEYVKYDGTKLLSPYEVLPPLEINGTLSAVREGTGAITAYQQMLYGEYRGNDEVKQRWAKLLRQYCQLDTLAMVIVYEHWRELAGL